MAVATTSLPPEVEELVSGAVAAALGAAVREAVREAVDRVVPGAVAVAVERAVAASLAEARADGLPELDAAVREGRRAVEETACEAVRGLTSVAASLVQVVSAAVGEAGRELVDPAPAPSTGGPTRFVGRAAPRPLVGRGSDPDVGPGLPYFVVSRTPAPRP